MSKPAICIVGSNGFIAGEFIRNPLVKEHFCIETISSKENAGDFLWDYRSEIDHSFEDYKFILNFTKSGSLKTSRHIIRELRKKINDNQIYIHFSSNAVFAEPVGLSRLIFRGDDYIRIKKFETKLVRRWFKNFIIVYPGAVLGEGGVWHEFFESKSRSYKKIHGLFPSPAQSQSIEVELFCDKLALNLIRNNSEKHLEIPDPREPGLSWPELFMQFFDKGQLVEKEYPYNFFKNPLKESVFMVLTSVFIPDSLCSRIMHVLRKRKTDPAPGNQVSDDYYIEGMTKFYISRRKQD